MTFKDSVHFFLLLSTRLILIQTTSSSDTTALALINPSPTFSCPSEQFVCKKNGVDTCLSNTDKCDGWAHCDDDSDELLSECDNCSAPHLSVWGKSVEV